MLRGSILALGLAASSCAPAPAAMPATQASEALAMFAAGSSPWDVCTPEGRAMLRSAVRAYGAEMARAGVQWPAVPAFDGAGEGASSVDVTVLAAFSAGFVEASDFRGRTRALINRLSLAQWPQVSGMRQAARVACAEVAALQQAAARLVLEAQRYGTLTAHAAQVNDPRAQALAERQALRVRRAQARMALDAALVEEAVRQAQGAS